MDIIENYIKIQKQVTETALSCGRNPEDIQIIAVSKTFPIETVQQAIDSGITIFGENKIQEAKRKIPELKGKFNIHMIGHLQSNKAKDAVKLFDLIHSIDKLSTAEKLNTEAEKAGKIQKILIQVNTSGETSKSGMTEQEVLNIITEFADLDNVEVLGLMAMAPYTDNLKIIRESFSSARILLEKINNKTGLGLKELSMGMSSDYKTAIEEGSTMVRIGSAIFGERNYL